MDAVPSSEAIFYAGYIGGGLSLIATTLVIGVSLYVEASSNTRTNLVFCLMCAQWLRGFSVVSGSIVKQQNGLQDFNPNFGCVLNGFFIEQTLVAGDISNLLIGVFTWLAFARKKQFMVVHAFLDRHYTSTFSFPWLIATLFGILAGIHPGYTPVKSNWCFISDVDFNLWRWIYAWSHRILFWILLLGMYGHIVILVLKSKQVLKQSSSTTSDENERKLNKAARKLFIYPLAYIIWGLPGILARVYDNKWLTLVVQASQSIGFIDAILYGYSEDLRRRFFYKLNSASTTEKESLYSDEEE